jgi:hypothetical protein
MIRTIQKNTAKGSYLFLLSVIARSLSQKLKKCLVILSNKKKCQIILANTEGSEMLDIIGI